MEYTETWMFLTVTSQRQSEHGVLIHVFKHTCSILMNFRWFHFRDENDVCRSSRSSTVANITIYTESLDCRFHRTRAHTDTNTHTHTHKHTRTHAHTHTRTHTHTHTYTHTNTHTHTHNFEAFSSTYVCLKRTRKTYMIGCAHETPF